MSLWTAAEAAAATGGSAAGDWAATGVAYDSRALAPGDLFCALTAARDGHDFVADALARGAAAALVSRVPAGVDPSRLLVVPDVLEGLNALARAARARSGARVLAITGSVGKTSTKDMARAALAPLGRLHAAEASLNNHWGVPLTLARMPAATDLAVIEIGMNHPGEIEPLARLAAPDVALVTTIAAAHLEAFEDIDGIAREKAAIFAGLAPGGTAILPADLPTTPILRAAAEAAGARILAFGTGGETRLISAEPEGEGQRIAADIAGTHVHARLASPGPHFALNAVAVLAAAPALGLHPQAAADAIADWRPYRGRGAVERAGDLLLLDDSYNANPASLRAGLRTLALLPPGRRIAILGDMLELGADEIAQHRAIADWPELAPVARIHAVGPRMRALWDALSADRRGLWTETAAEMCARADALAAPGDVVFVKGSKFSRVASVVDALRSARQRAPSRTEG